MSKPTVSVVIPTYNREATISRAVRSVLNQEGDGDLFEIIEVIVVDDGSTDSTEDVLNEIHDSRIKYHKMPENGGVSRARNTGAGMAVGEWIAFQDSDDEWMPDKMKKQMVLAEKHPEYAMVYTGMKVIESNGREYPFCLDFSGNLFQKLAVRNFIGAPTIIVKNEVWRDFDCFDSEMPALEDWDMVLRFSAGHEIGCVPEPLLLYHLDNDGVSSKATNHFVARCMIIAKNRKTLVERECFESATESLLRQAAEEGLLGQVGALLESYLKTW